MNRSAPSGPEPLLASGPVILGSRSPQRRRLMESVISSDQLWILPPSNPEESGFDGLSRESEIETRLLEIVDHKHQNLLQQVHGDSRFTAARIVVADTIVIARTSAHEESSSVAGTGVSSRRVLGQPGPVSWQDDVRQWFHRWLSGAPHDVWTAVCVSRGSQQRTFVVRSVVTFADLTESVVEWYIGSGESVGKAGGYAIQGLGAALVQRVEGSLTNVIGLPLLEVVEALRTIE